VQTAKHAYKRARNPARGAAAGSRSEPVDPVPGFPVSAGRPAPPCGGQPEKENRYGPSWLLHETLETLRAGREDADRVYHFKPVWQRALIVLAGPAANFLLAVALFSALGMVRGDVTIEPRIGEIVEGSPADEAGFQSGDLLVSIDGQRVGSFTDLTQTVMTRAGTPMRFTVDRGGREFLLEATPRREMRPDGLGGTRAFGFLGVGLSPDAQLTRHRFGPVEAVGHESGRV